MGNRNFGAVKAHIVTNDIKTHICQRSDLDPAVTVRFRDRFEDSTFFDPADHSSFAVGLDTQIHISECNIAVEICRRTVNGSDVRSGDLKPGTVAFEDLHFFTSGEFHCGRGFQFREYTGVEE